MSLYICWKEETSEFTGEWQYQGMGEFAPIMKQTTTTKRALYSSNETEEMKEKAHRYIKTDVPNGWIETR